MIRINRYKYSYLFSIWLVSRIKFEIMSKVLNSNFKPLENYLRKELKINQSIYQVISKCIESIEIVKLNSSYVIQINQNKKYNDILVKTISKIIDYGTIDLKGYSIFSSIFDNINKNLDVYYYIYKPGYH